LYIPPNFCVMMMHQLSRIIPRGQSAGFRAQQGGLRPHSARSCVGNVDRLATHAPVRLMRKFCSTPGATSTILSPLRGALATMRRFPFSAQIFIATTKTAAADLITQTCIEKKKWEDVDWKRVSVFTLFGFVYLGVIQWGIYVVAYKRIFKHMDKFCNQSVREKLKNKAGMMEVVQQIAIDTVLICPLLYIPLYYVLKKGVERSSPDTFIQLDKETVSEAMGTYKKNFFEDNFGMLFFWLPADVVIYSVPLWLRLPLNHTVSFAWCCIMSFVRGGSDDGEAEKAVLETTAV